MDHYYVYMYSDQDGEPFYIGKGHGNRLSVSQHMRKCHSFLRNKINKLGPENVQIEILHDNLPECVAFELERYYIKGYGRRDLGLGPLCNLSDGGDGNSGHKHTLETRKKMSISKQNNKSHLGFKHTEVSKRKMSDATKRQMAEGKLVHLFKKGRKLSAEEKLRISIQMKNRICTDETKKKLSILAQAKWAKRKGGK